MRMRYIGCGCTTKEELFHITCCYHALLHFLTRVRGHVIREAFASFTSLFRVARACAFQNGKRPDRLCVLLSHASMSCFRIDMALEYVCLDLMEQSQCEQTEDAPEVNLPQESPLFYFADGEQQLEEDAAFPSLHASVTEEHFHRGLDTSTAYAQNTEVMVGPRCRHITKKHERKSNYHI